MANFCYIPQKGIDDVIAEHIKNSLGNTTWTEHRVATLRGLYDEYESIPLDINNPAKAASTLIRFRADLAKRNMAKINKVFESKKSIGSNLGKIYKQIKKIFNAEDRFNRITMISTLFSVAVDDLHSKYPNLSREAIIRGVNINGTKVGGQSAIFSRVFNEILYGFEKYNREGDKEKADKYKDILDNWSGLVSYARIRLRDTEGITLDNKLVFVEEANEGNLSEVESSFDPTEAKREAWQEENDKHSAFGSISKEVRKALGSIQLIENGEPVYDDLGFPIMLDPVNAHQILADLLIGVSDENQVLRILVTNIDKFGWLKPLVEDLKNNHRLRTQFYVDFHKGHQLYSIMGQKDSNNGIIHWYTKVINDVSRDHLSNYITTINLGRTLGTSSVFNKQGYTNWENLKIFRDGILKDLKELKDRKVDSSINIFNSNNQKAALKKDKINKVRDLLHSLGIDIDYKNLSYLGKDLDKVIDILINIAENGINKLTPESNLEYNIKSNKKVLFFNYIDSQRDSTDYKISKDINKILTILHKHNKNLKFERRARHKDSKGKTITYDSYVNPSFMSDVFGRIRSYVDNNDAKGLQNYIKQKFLSSSYFYDKKTQVGDEINPDKILNQWVKELYLSTLDSKGNPKRQFDGNEFANNFTFERFLGNEEGIPFEDFTSKQHLISVLEMYWSDMQQFNPHYAHYPVFILGDSGVAKYIKARRYSKDQILDGMYKVFLQEQQRMKLAQSTKEALESKGYKTIDNFSNNINKYSILTFLNEEKYAKLIDPSKYEESVKLAISTYMSDATAKFKKQAETLGVLETTTVGEGVAEYVNLVQNASPKNIDSVLEDFYWNSTFAMINQLQFFTIDPSFYKGTKDLQKRYKEIHAPGTAISVLARDFDGNLYSPSKIERVIYFEDIVLPAPDDFLSAIEHNEYTKKHLKTYYENTLTDGQGYRSLDSYRKVMGMAGQWTEEHEAAYKKIKSLREKYRDSVISSEDLAEIAELSVIFQPIKPYLFTHEKVAVNENDVLLVPVQHKYAEAVLIPELLPKGKLKSMAYYMEDNDIDVICSTTCVKVGNYGSATVDYKTNENNLYVDSEGNIIPIVDEEGNPLLDSKGEELKLTAENQKKSAVFKKLAVDIDDSSFIEQLKRGEVHNLSYEDYRIQTNVPAHLDVNQLFGTQVRKLVMAFLNKEDYSDYVGSKEVNLGKDESGVERKVKLTKTNLISFYNALIVANILESFEEFEKQASSKEELSNMLIQNVLSNLRESLDNINAFALNEDGDFSIPLFEGELEHDSSATLFSTFKKKVNKQRIKGGSAVQVSAFGITDKKETEELNYVIDPDNENNILYAECEIAFDLSWTDSRGNFIPLKFEDWCNSDGTLILGDEILDRNHPEYKKYLSYKDDKGNVRKPKIEEKYPGILSFIAYRIPTERDYSMINLQIKRFSPKTAGGTIKVPLQGTKIAGFDFDIDKLYFMMREFKFKEKRNYKKLTNQEEIDIWNRVWKKYGNIYSALYEYRKIEVDKGNLPANTTLNSVWDTVVPSYDKNEIFEEAAKDLGINLGEYEVELIPDYSYDYDKTPLQNNKTQRNNMLIELIQQRLMDAETFSQRYTPGGFAGASKSARMMRELLFGDTSKIYKDGRVDFEYLSKISEDKKSDPEPNYNPTDIMTLITYNQQNQVAGKLIGIFANQNTNHAFSSLMNSFSLKKPISFCGHSYDDLLNAPEGVDVDLNIAEFLAASVDAVKDPVLNFLNFNTLTADAGALLARIGYTTEEIGLLFNQPIIKEACEYAFNNNTSLEVAISTIRTSYEGVSEGKQRLVSKEVALSKDSLAVNILNNRASIENNKDARSNSTFAANQLVILDLFESVVSASKDVSRFVTSSKFTASNAVGSTFGDMYAQQMRVKKYLEDANSNSLAFTASVTKTINRTINNDEEMLKMSKEDYMFSIKDNPFGYEQCMYDMNRKVKNLLTKYFPYDTKLFKESRELIASLTKSGTLDADTINSIHRDLLAFLLYAREGGLFNAEQPMNIEGQTMKARDYYLNVFPKRLFDTITKYPELKKFMILSPDFLEFSSEVNKKTGASKTVIKISNVGGLVSHQEDALKESIEELAVDYPYIVRDLFMYSFYKTGFNYSPFAFMNIIPNSVKESIIVDQEQIGDDMKYITYPEFLRRLLDPNNSGIEINPNEFAQQYILNHTDNYNLVFAPKGSALDEIEGIYNKGGAFNNDFTLDSGKGNISKLYVIGKNSKGQLLFRPCLKIKGMLYIAKGDGDTFNASSSGSITYERVYSLGTTNKELRFLSPTEELGKYGIIEDDYFVGNTSITPEEDNTTFDRVTHIRTLAEDFKKAFDAADMRDEQGELMSLNTFIAWLSDKADEDLKQTIEVVRKACRKDGILVLNEKGDLMENC